MGAPSLVFGGPGEGFGQWERPFERAAPHDRPDRTRAANRREIIERSDPTGGDRRLSRPHHALDAWRSSGTGVRSYASDGGHHETRRAGCGEPPKRRHQIQVHGVTAP